MPRLRSNILASHASRENQSRVVPAQPLIGCPRVSQHPATCEQPADQPRGVTPADGTGAASLAPNGAKKFAIRWVWKIFGAKSIAGVRADLARTVSSGRYPGVGDSGGPGKHCERRSLGRMPLTVFLDLQCAVPPGTGRRISFLLAPFHPDAHHCHCFALRFPTAPLLLDAR